MIAALLVFVVCLAMLSRMVGPAVVVLVRTVSRRARD
jgi:hypothetical protein